MSERKFHFTTYPFSDFDIDRTIPAVDIKKGDWVQYTCGLHRHYYRVIFAGESGNRVSLFFHGAPAKVYSAAEDVIVVKDPTAPVEDPEEVNLLEQLREALAEVESHLQYFRDHEMGANVVSLLETKAKLLIAITEHRRSAKNGA